MKNQAIEIIQEAKENHVTWANYLRAHPEEVKQPRPEVDVAGDVAHHEV